MKILLYSFDYHPCTGGVNTFVEQLIVGLRHRGHTVDFLNSTHIKFLPKTQLENISMLQSYVNAQYIDVPAIIKNLEILCYAHEELVRTIDLSSYDIIHSNNGISSYVISKLAPKIPLFGTVHGSYVYEAVLNGTIKPEQSMLLAKYDEYAVKCPTITHTVSKSMTRFFPGLPLEKHVVIHNSIDVTNFNPILNNNLPIRICAAGILNYRKGYDLLEAALEILSKRGIFYEMTFFGDGPLLGSLQLSCDKKKLPVKFRGVISHITLCKELSQFDIFVQPSRFETFGLAVTEAMAAGCAVVCSNIGELAEQIVHEDNGLLFKSEDVLDLTETLLRLIEDSKLRSHLRKRALEVVKQKFSIETSLQKFEDAYKQAINKKNHERQRS